MPAVKRVSDLETIQSPLYSFRRHPASHSLTTRLTMQSLALFWIISLSLLSGSTFALPYGCGGEIGVLNVTEGGYNGLIWTCSDIDPGYPSLYQSGQNYLYSLAETHNASDCANYCSGWFNDGMNAGVYYPNSTCECWVYGDLNSSPSAATATSGSATFLDFYETEGLYRPNTAQHWGEFTCPDGAYYNWFWQQGIPYRGCYPLTIEPGQAALKDCPSPGTQWETWTTVDGWEVVTACYAKLSAAKVSLNFSSPYTLIDVYDFTSHTSTSTKATSTSTSKKTTSTSTSKKTTSTSTHHTSTSTRKSTSTPKTISSKKPTSTAKVHTTVE